MANLAYAEGFWRMGWRGGWRVCPEAALEAHGGLAGRDVAIMGNLEPRCAPPYGHVF